MIDWITAIVPFDHHTPISGGVVVSTTAEGEIEYEVTKRAVIKGSFDDQISIRSHNYSNAPAGGAAAGRSIEIHGNPAKFLQGHNIHGTDDLRGLVTGFMHCVSEIYNTPQTQEVIAAWEQGRFTLRRVDVNYSWHLRSLADVLSWIRSAEHSAHMRRRGKGELTKNGTLYFGKHSRRWGFKFYAKGHELGAHTLPVQLADTPLFDYAQTLLRGELVLRSQELKRLDLANGTDWNDTTANSVFENILTQLELNDMHTLTNEIIDQLPPRLKLVYTAWQAGQDIRAMFPKKTFYRHRNALLPHGVDIAVKQPRDSSRDNVVPLVRVLEAVPAEIPQWMYDQNLIFIPPKKSA